LLVWLFADRAPRGNRGRYSQEPDLHCVNYQSCIFKGNHHRAWCWYDVLYCTTAILPPTVCGMLRHISRAQKWRWKSILFFYWHRLVFSVLLVGGRKSIGCVKKISHQHFWSFFVEKNFTNPS